jgi:tetratricopeptide (TPR) repeat protein
MPTKKANAGSDRRFAQAVEAFEKAVKALGKRDYEKARDLFDQLIQGFPDERDLLDRAHSYREVCRKALDTRPGAKPKGFDALLAHAVLTHNRGEFDEALKLLEQALGLEPTSDDALYCLAASAAQAGHTDRALEALGKAIEIEPGNRAQARSDSDFDALRESEAFIDLVYTQS